MDEFLKLILTGKQRNAYFRFRSFRAAFSAIGALLMLVPVFLPLMGVWNAPLTVTFSVLGVLFELGGVGFGYASAAYARALMNVEHAAEELGTNEPDRQVSPALYEAWKACFGRPRVGEIVPAALRAAASLALAAVCVAVALGALPAEWVFWTCLICGAVSCVSAGYGAVSEGAAVTKLYGLAEREIDALKHAQGKTDREIAYEAELSKAYSTVPRTVELFLKDRAEREDFRVFSGRSSLVAVLSGVVLGAGVIFGGPLIASKLGETTMWYLVGVLCVLVATALIGIVYPLQRRLKIVYARNAMKLSEDETDALRARLQAAWCFQQKVGNCIFGFAIAAAVLAGVILGIVGYARDPSSVLIVQIGGCVFGLLIWAAILSLIVWTVFYCIQRRKLRPIEAELTRKLREQG